MIRQHPGRRICWFDDSRRRSKGLVLWFAAVVEDIQFWYKAKGREVGIPIDFFETFEVLFYDAT